MQNAMNIMNNSYLHIDMNIFRKNMNTLLASLPAGVQLIPVLKDDAYGLGLVFQIVDDVLDVTSTPEQLGKPIGSDSENGKTTFVTLYGADGAMALAQKLNEQICDDLQQHFGAKAAFLQQLAQQLLVRKN